MAPSLPLRLPRSDAFASPTTADQQTREAPGGTRESLGNTTWAVVAIVLGAFLMVTLVIFAVLYYMRWRQLAQTTAAALAAARDGGGGGGNGSDWEEPAGGVRQPQQQHHHHHRSPRLPLDPKAAVVVAVGRARAASSSSLGGGPRRGLRRMTSEDQAEAHELERTLMIRKSLASRESWGSNASSQNNNNNNNNNSSNSQNGNGNNNNTTTTRDEAGHATPASRHRSHDSLKSWEAGADGSRRNSRVVLPAASAESLRGHPALEGQTAPSSRTSLVPPPAPAPALERRRMSPLPPLPSVHTR